MLTYYFAPITGRVILFYVFLPVSEYYGLGMSFGTDRLEDTSPTFTLFYGLHCNRSTKLCAFLHRWISTLKLCVAKILGVFRHTTHRVGLAYLVPAMKRCTQNCSKLVAGDLPKQAALAMNLSCYHVGIVDDQTSSGDFLLQWRQ